MKRAIIIVCLLVGLVIIPFFTFTNDVKPREETKPLANNYKPAESLEVELYQDIFITLLLPYIDKAIDNYYGEYLKALPHEDPWHVKILNVERPNGDRTSLFVIKLEVMPYIGPHNNVGRDQITIRVQSDSEPKVEKFEHIESYPIPPNYQNIIIKWPPPL